MSGCYTNINNKNNNNKCNLKASMNTGTLNATSLVAKIAKLGLSCTVPGSEFQRRFVRENTI